MKTHAVFLVLASTTFSLNLSGQAFSSGSNGSYGAIDITANTTLTTPPDGIFHATTINVAAGSLLTFTRNEHNTPIYLLATGDVDIAGDISVSGGAGSNVAGGLGGQGGFDGGNPGSINNPPGDGHGPGGGLGGNEGYASQAGTAGPATYAQTLNYATENKGSPYGSPLLIPMLGGSGGGGSTGLPGSGGGGGGGALLIASSTSITLGNNTDITADGNNGAGSPLAQNGGSGGAIRLVAPVIISTGARLYARGYDNAGDGRIRIDTLDRKGLNFSSDPNWSTSIGSMMVVFPTPLPRLDVIHAAGMDIALGSSPVFVNLDFGTDPNQIVRVQAQDFNAVVPISVVLVPDHGDKIIFEDEIDNLSNNPATVEVPVTFPVNVTTTIHVWTR